MTTKEKIYKAINDEANNSSPTRREEYEDDYDGFTHSTYSGLAEEIEEALIEEGYEGNIPMSVIEDFTSQIF